MIAPSLVPVDAQGSILEDGCDAHAGTPLQWKLDAAHPGDTIIACAGIYPERLVVRVANLTLEGKAGAILDGSALVGQRAAISLDASSKNFRLVGFEIRNYRDPTTTPDASSGIVIHRGATGVKITNTTINDNGFVGILAWEGKASGLTLTNVSIARHKIANALLHGIDHARITKSNFNASGVGLVLAGVGDAEIAYNNFASNAFAGISASPTFGTELPSNNVRIHHNTVAGSRVHGVWALGLTESNISYNTFVGPLAPLTLAGDPTQIRLQNNSLSVGFEKRTAPTALDTFKNGPPTESNGSAQSPTSQPQFAPPTNGGTCAGLDCFLGWIGARLDALIPTASAQVPNSDFICDQDCVGLITQTLQFALNTALNPTAEPSDTNEITRLAACQGEPDACLTAGFINATDTNPANTWSIAVSPGVELRFIDAGTRRTNESLGWRRINDQLDQNFTTLVLCRLYVAGTPQNCASLPRGFDYGLDLTWAGTTTSRRISAWQTFLPTNTTHATFNRYHSTDATLFKATTLVHHAASPPAPGIGTTQTPDAERSQYAGTATLRCNIIPSNDPLNFTGTTSSCPAYTLVKEPNPAKYYWCTANLDDLTREAYTSDTLRQSSAAELTTGLPTWSQSCQATTFPVTTYWKTLLNDADLHALAEAQGRYYTATTESQRVTANRDAENVTLRAVARHIAIGTKDSGLPNAEGTKDVTPLEWDTGSVQNLNVNAINVIDIRTTNGWQPTLAAGLVTFLPARLSLDVAFTQLNGDPATTPLNLTILADNATSTPAFAVNYSGKTLVNVLATDPNNLDYAQNFTPNSTRVQTWPLINVTHDGAVIGQGLFDATFTYPTTGGVTVCLQELASARTDGTKSNLANAEAGLAVPNMTGTTPCAPYASVPAVNLNYFAGLLVTLVVEEGDVVAPFLPLVQIIGNVTSSLVKNGTTNTNFTVTQALVNNSTYNLSEPTHAGSIRIKVVIPRVALPEEKAALLAALLVELSPVVGIFAIGIEGIPLTLDLQKALQNATRDFGAVVLVPTGTLPETASALAVQDKLMTIQGLAASPLVITIGAGDVATGVAPSSRLGPATTLAPKPDFVAPSPIGTTIGALFNALPFVEAVALRGNREVNLIRATLGAFALPVRDEHGAPATFWQQGFGALDLGYYLGLNNATDLIWAVHNSTGDSNETIKQNASNSLGISVANFEQSSASSILGTVVNPEPLLRLATTNTLLHFVIDTPALPSSIQADFGVVNNEKVGVAGFTPIDLDALLNVTARSLGALLRDAAYTGEADIDGVVNRVTDIINLTAIEGQNVTLNATHYYFTDLLKDDLLYTLYDSLLTQTVADNPDFVDDATANAVVAVKNDIADWLLQPHYLTEETQMDASLDAGLSLQCANVVPFDSIRRVGNVALQTVRGEMFIALETAKAPEAQLILDTLPADMGDLISKGNQQFVQDELRQLMCLHDAHLLLASLMDITENARAVKRLPWGALDETEAWEGTFDETLLGGQLKTTLTSIGVDPVNVAGQSSTLLLDAVFDLLVKTNRLLDDKVGLLGMPKLFAKNPRPGVLATIPSRTSNTAENPLGLYVGLATMTSHNVSVINPITNETLARRDVTIPVPSFLWNNPTLVTNWTYRDTTPLDNGTIVYYDQEPNVFDTVSVALSHTATNGVIVPLVMKANERLEREKLVILARIENVTAALNATIVTSLDTPLKAKTHDVLTRFNDTLNNRLTEINNLLTNDAWQLDSTTSDAVKQLLNNVVPSLVSRLTYQHNSTDANGQAQLPNLFPGSYTMFQPYPYPIALDPTLPRDPKITGKEALAGPMNDTAFSLARNASFAVNGVSELARSQDDREQEAELIGTPSGGSLTTCAPAPTCDFTPFFEVRQDNSGLVHQFGFSMTGPDLFGVACEQLRDLGERTKTQLLYAGCDDPLLDGLALSEILDLVHLSACLNNLPHVELASLTESACASALQEMADNAAACENDDVVACERTDDAQDFVQNLTSLVSLLGNVSSAQHVVVPFVHSPVRALKEDRERFGYSQAALLNATKSKNPLSTPIENITAAINETLAALPEIANLSLVVNEPPRTSFVTRDEPEGILYRVTDDVSGLDWYQFDVGRTVAQAGEDVRTLFSDLINVVVNIRDQDLVANYSKALNDLASDGVVADAFNASGQSTLKDRARALASRLNGTSTIDGLNITAQFAPDAAASCASATADQVNSSALTSAYFSCPLQSLTSQRADLYGTGHVDKVQAANVLLEILRRTTIPASTSPDYVPTLLSILQETVNASMTDAGQQWSRTTDAISMEAGTNLTAAGHPTVAVPSLGVLTYSLPVPEQEYVVQRIDAEIMQRNTASLLITSTNPAIYNAVINAVNLLNASNLTKLPVTLPPPPTPNSDAQGILEYGRDQVPAALPWPTINKVNETMRAAQNATINVINALDDAVRELNAETSTLRITPIGFPFGIEQKFQPRASLNDCVFCEHGLFIAQPGEYQNVSKTYEFNTKGNPAANLYVMLVYFPTIDLVDQNGVSLGGAIEPQKLVISNFTVQLTTYVGLATPTVADGDLRTHTLGLPLRFNSRIEDWKMYYALPDQKPHLTPYDDGSLDVNVTLHGKKLATFTPTSDSFVQSAAPEWGTGRCPNENAPGFFTTSFRTPPKAVPSPGFYSTESNPCLLNTVEGLRPQHVNLAKFENWTSRRTSKSPADALQYIMNVENIHRESLTRQESNPIYVAHCNVLCDPLGFQLSISPNGLPPNPLSEIVGTIANAVRAAADTASGSVVTALPLRNPILDITDAIPFIHNSFSAGAQGGFSGLNIAPDPKHQYLVLTQDDALAMLAYATDNDSNLSIGSFYLVIRDTSRASQQAVIHSPENDSAPTRKLLLRDTSDHQGIVLAHETKVIVDQPEEDEDSAGGVVMVVHDLVVGNGQAGAGFALTLAGKFGLGVTDTDKFSFLDGLAAGQGTGITAKVYSLGGNATAIDPACTFPLYGYIQPYWHCDGQRKLAFEVGISAGAHAECYQASLIYLRKVANTTVAGSLNSGDLLFSTSAQTRNLLESKLMDEATPRFETNHAAAYLTQTTAYAQSLLIEAGVLAECLQAGPALGVEWYLLGLNESAAGNKTGIGAAARQAFNVTSPFLYEHGQGQRFMTTHVTPDPLHLAKSWINDDDSVVVHYGADEWSTRLRNGSVKLTAKPPVGPPESEVIAETNRTSHLTPLAPLPILYFGQSAAWANDAVYLFGGQLAGPNTIRKYDPTTGVTSTMSATLPQQRSFSTAAWDGHYIYVFGGASDQIVRYDPTLDIATVVATQAVTNKTGMASAWDGADCIYLAGGRNSTSEATAIYKYCPTANTFTTEPVTLNPRTDAGAIYVDGVLYVIGGRWSGGSRTDVLAYHPGEVLQVVGRLPGSGGNISAFWDGQYATILGNAQGAPVRFDPRTSWTKRLDASGMNATRYMVSVWNGSRGIILGGAHNTTAVNEVLAYDPVNNFLPGSPYANLTIAAKQGHEYLVELNASDEFGYSYPASVRFSVDRLSPELSCPVSFYANASLTPACSIWDNTSGVSRVVVGHLPDNGAANYTMSDDYLGAKSVALNLSLPFGPNLTVVVNITDKAGNYRNETRRVIFDDTPPDITAILAGIQNNIIRVNKLDSIANAWDNASGLASVEVYLRNRAGDSWLVNSTTLNASALSLADTTTPWHTSLLNFSHIYTVDVRATDNAGNVNDTRSNSTRLTLGAVLTPPKGTANLPSRLNTSFFGRLPLMFNASVANGRFALDEVTLRLWNGSTTLINQSWNNTTATTFNQIWNSTATPWTAYDVSFTARSATDMNTTNLIVWRPSDPRTTTAANVSNLSAYENFANLTNSSDYNVYRISYSIKCVGVWSVTVASLDGEDVDLYMTPDPDPISDASTNTADYAFSDTTTSSTATLTFAGTGGNDYMVLIKKKGPNATDYQLIYDASCNAKDTRDPPSQSETLGNPTVSWNGP